MENDARSRSAGPTPVNLIVAAGPACDLFEVRESDLTAGPGFRCCPFSQRTGEACLLRPNSGAYLPVGWIIIGSGRAKQSLIPGKGTQVHENRELGWARWIRCGGHLRAPAERAHLGPRYQPVSGAVAGSTGVAGPSERGYAIRSIFLDLGGSPWYGPRRWRFSDAARGSFVPDSVWVGPGFALV